MSLREQQIQRNSEILRKYIPEFAVPQIAIWIIEFDFKLKITKERSTKLGDYTSPRDGLNHTITINHNLNQYSFFITLVHEIAHLHTFNQFKNRVNPHGEEWKQSFRVLMTPILSTDHLPLDVLYALRKYLQIQVFNRRAWRQRGRGARRGWRATFRRPSLPRRTRRGPRQRPRAARRRGS